MASLVGQQLKDTYDSLLKTSDNDALGGTYKEITDGSGNGSGLYLGTGGNVGIGTDSPSTKLQVTDGHISAYHNINANTAGYGIQFFTNAGGSKNTIATIQPTQVGTTRSGSLLFSTSDNGAPTERLRIHSTGDISFRDGSASEAFYWNASTARLGIGNTNPQAKLDVEGGILSSGGIAALSASNIFIDQVTSIKSRIGVVGADASTAGTLAISQYSSNGSVARDALTIDSSGNVGIGATSPATLNHISASYSAPTGGIDANVQLLISNTSGYAGFNIIGGSSGGAFINFGDTDDSNVGQILYTSSNDSLNF